MAPKLTTETTANKLYLGGLAVSQWRVKHYSLHLIRPLYSQNCFGSLDVKLAEDTRDLVLNLRVQGVLLRSINLRRRRSVLEINSS